MEKKKVNVSAENVAEVSAKIRILARTLEKEKESDLLWWLKDELSRVLEVGIRMHKDRKSRAEAMATQ